MATAILDGVSTRYEIQGDDSSIATPVLMFSPGGFDATLEKWSSFSVYARVKPLDALAKYRRIVFDRRECGQSGGKVERVTWTHFAKQAKALMDHLGIERAHLMGGCMGCSPILAFAAHYPKRVASMVLYWPVGGVKYRLSAHQRFAEHLGYVQREGLAAVVALVQKDGKPFGGDPRGGPWASVIKSDPDFASEYTKLDVEQYKITVAGMARLLFDRDTAPGADPEDLLTLQIPALIVPGRDPSHATSAARYLEECLPRAQYWDVPVEAQQADNFAQTLNTFLSSTV